MTFIYNRSKVRDRKLLEHARRLGKGLEEVDIDTEKLATSHFGQYARTHNPVFGLLDPRIVEGHQIEHPEQAISLINRKPQLLKTPIVVTSRKMWYVQDAGDLAILMEKTEADSSAASH